jgi:hypothetical protein
MLKLKDLSFGKEEFYIIFDGLNRPKIWDVFYKIIKWCDSYTTFHLSTLEINKDYVHYFLSVNTFITDVKWIYVSINKPKHRIDYEDKQIKIFKEMIVSKFKKAKPVFEKELPNGFKEDG